MGRLISGKWRLDALIGVGGMAAVYMATHRNGNLAAVKILHEEVSLNQEVRERFLREAYIANKVNHSGTVKVLDDDRDELGAPYIVMELLTGETVESRAQRAGGRLSIEETLDILDRSLAVLEAAHAQTIVHRDLKPENLFLTDQGQLKVLDFGIARLREENQQRRTQTGLVMGTPAFMAPEQAMGRWNDVDLRTDLWAMAATAFTLLTGLPVHEAETAGEMLIAAATRPARSLARVLPGAPFALVALVDRGLAYERDNRFPDAQSFRAELAKIRASVTAEAAAIPKADAPQKPLIPATVHSRSLAQPLVAAAFDSVEDDDKEVVDTFDPSNNSDEEIARMAKFFSLLERALTATKQYAPDHPEPKRRFDDAFRELAAALMTCDVALAWDLTPYSFGARDQVIWEPEAPWNRIPYQLFADGVRMMGFAPGLDLSEFMRWTHIVTLDPATDFAPEDDLVTLLWDENLEHVFFQAIDSFAEGNQDQRARYEAERAQVIAGAHIDHRAELTKAVSTEKQKPAAKRDKSGDVQSKGRELFRLMARSESTDAEAAARVANLNITDVASDNEASSSLQVDNTALTLLAARMEIDVAAVSERFISVAADAFVVSAKMGRSAAVTAPLRRAIDSLGSTAPTKAVEMILELRDAVGVDGKELDTDSLRQTMTSEILSAPTLLAMLQAGDELQGDAKTEYLKGVTRVLGCLQPQHFDSALSYLEQAEKGELRDLILRYLQRTGRGNEAKIGALFPKVEVDLGLALVRLLSELDTPAAKDAIGMASQSPHALVRIEALGHIEGASGSRLRLEIKKLLDDTDENVRLAALQAMETHNIVIAGAFLVLRIQQQDFPKLPLAERKQALQTLSKLRPKRCEEVCIELLSQGSLLRARSSEETRELASQYLGELASSDAALFLLESIAKSSALKNSKRMRDAADAALTRLKTRVQEAIERKIAERKQTTGQTPAQRTSSQEGKPKSTSQVGVDASAARTGAPELRKKNTSQVSAGAPEPKKKSSSSTSQVSAEPPPANDNNSASPATTSPGTGRVTKPSTGDKPDATNRQVRSRS
ncbi:MAG TPA: serine/threonine-protein kinase [Polyangiales bacterium]|nr:serine/threonine-protein kinase [Polyangiales bacterium]